MSISICSSPTRTLPPAGGLREAVEEEEVVRVLRVPRALLLCNLLQRDEETRASRSEASTDPTEELATKPGTVAQGFELQLQRK